MNACIKFYWNSSNRGWDTFWTNVEDFSNNWHYHPRGMLVKHLNYNIFLATWLHTSKCYLLQWYPIRGYIFCKFPTDGSEFREVRVSFFFCMSQTSSIFKIWAFFCIHIYNTSWKVWNQKFSVLLMDISALQILSCICALWFEDCLLQSCLQKLDAQRTMK